MTEKHFPPAVGEFAARELYARRERNRALDELAEAVEELASFEDLEAPVACPCCAPLSPEGLERARLRVHRASAAARAAKGEVTRDAV